MKAGSSRVWLICAVLASSATADDLPNPYVRSEQPTIGPAPVPVMEQMFWVQLKLDPASEVQVVCPEGVWLLDKTKPGKGRQWTRFYFRAGQALQDARIVLRPTGAAEIMVPLRVLSYREDITDKSRDLPGFSDSVRKRGRSFHTDEMIARAKANMIAHPDLAKHLREPTQYDAMTDAQLWQSLPSWSVPRRLYGDWPCPFCGEKIYTKDTFYPWLAQDARHCRCPECRRAFPTNDVSKDDYTSGEFPDDGWGWDATGNGTRSDASAWVAYANFRHWINYKTGREIQSLATRCLLLGDKDAGHRAGLLLARMAYVYPGMDMRWQSAGKGGRAAKIVAEAQWEAWRLMGPAMEAYDAIWEYLETDRALVDFLRAKDPSVTGPEDVRRLIDVFLVQHYGLNRIRAWYRGDNGGWEMWMVHDALCANMGEASDRWLRAVFTRAWNTGKNEGGFQDACLVNYVTREGPTNIGNLQYSSSSLDYLTEIADCLNRYPDAKWRTIFNLYDEERFPRFRAMFDAYMDLRVSGQYAPQFGDSHNWRRLDEARGDFVRENLKPYLRAYSHWPTDRLALELSKIRRQPVELFEPDLWPKIEAQAKQAAAAEPLESRVLDGVGEVILESRAVAPNAADRAGLALRYGYGWGHAHQDNLNIELWAHGAYLLPELGYPNWVHRLGSTSRTAHHITGLIDRGDQYPRRTARGSLETFAAAPEASFVEVSSQPVGAQVYRRAVALLDAPGNGSYVFDVFRLKGGTTRTYSFHGPEDSGFESNLQFGEKAEPIFTNLMEPQRATSDADIAATWRVKGKPLHLRLNLLGARGRSYTTAHFGKVDAPPIRFLLAEESGKEKPSQFVALVEPYEQTPIVEKIDRLAVTGGAEPEGFEPVALRVTLVGGQTDTLIYSQDSKSLHRTGDIELQGTFGYVSERDGKLRAMHLANGTLLQKNGRGLRLAAPSYSAKIVNVDLTNYTVTLDRRLPCDGALDGRQMGILAGGKHRTSYHIRRVLPPGDQVQFDLSSEIYQSRLVSTNPKTNTLSCELAPFVEAAEAFPPGYYDGALLTDESRTARYRVVKVEGKKIHVDRAPVESDFSAKDPLDRRMVHIFDFGEGDQVTVQTSAFARKGADAKWETSGPSAAEFVLE